MRSTLWRNAFIRCSLRGTRGIETTHEPPISAISACPRSARASLCVLPQIFQLRRHPLANRLPVHHNLPVAWFFPQNVSESQQIKRFRLPFPSLRGIVPNSIRRVFSGCSCSSNFAVFPADRGERGTAKLEPDTDLARVRPGQSQVRAD